MLRKKFDELTIIDNYMFSKVMLNERLCKQFLEMVIGKKISRITFPNYERAIDIRYDAKSIRLDVILEDEEHTVYNLEMQATPHDYLVKRTRYYQDLIDLDQIEKGQKYNELNRSLIIFVCTYDPFGLGRHIYSFKNLCSEDTNLALEDGTEKIFVNTVGTMDDVDATFQDVMNFFNGFAPQGVFAKQLQEEVKRVKESEKWRREYMTLEIFMDDARTEERKIGREEGLQEGRSRYLIEQVYKKYRKGQSSDAIAEDLLEDSSLVQRIVDEIEKHQSGGTCDIDALYSELYGERE